MKVKVSLKSLGSIMLVFIMLVTISLVVSAPTTTMAAGTAYYVDSVNGNDNNNGTSTSTAWQTLTKASTITYQAGDSILLKAGCTWSGQKFSARGSGTSGNLITIDMYGTGNKPIISVGGSLGEGVLLENVSYWKVRNLEITNTTGATTEDGIARRGIMLLATNNVGALYGITVELCNIHDILGSTDFTDNDGRDYPKHCSGGILIRQEHGFGGDTNVAYFNGVTIQNNTIHDTNCMAIEAFGDNWIQTYSPIVYHQNVLIDSNTIYNTHTDGILLTHCQNPIMQYNSVRDAGQISWNSNNKYICGMWWARCNGGTVQNNEVTRTKLMGNDGNPFDVDYECIGNYYIQYNYSHSNDNGLVLNMINNASQIVVRYNISEDDSGCFRNDDDNLVAYNNTFYSTTKAGSFTSSGNGQYYNNIFYFPLGCSYESGATYEYNCYYGHIGPGTHAVNADPLLVSPGAGNLTYSELCATGKYKLQSNSPCINAGTSITNNGDKDFWGYTLYNGSPDIGANEYNGIVPTSAPTPTPTPSELNLALNKTVTASSSFENYGWFRADVIDGQRNSVSGAYGWSSSDNLTTNHTESIQIDLEASNSISKVDLYPRNDSGNVGECFPVNFTIQVSTNGTSWTTVETQTNYAKPGNAVQSFTFSSQSARYVKVEGTSLRQYPGDSKYYMQFAEVEVYGGSEATPTPTPTLTPTPTPTPTPGATWTKADDSNASVTYGGSWITDTYYLTYNSTRHYTNSANAYGQYTFTGTGIRWYGETDTNRGYADIYIDDVLDTTLDTYGTMAYQVKHYEKIGLTSGPHTIKVVCKGTKNGSSSNTYITIDVFEYLN